MARPKKSTETKKVTDEVRPSAVLQAGFINPIPETKTVTPEILNVYSVRYQLWHPFQKRMIPVNDPVPVIKDNWLQCQMKAGLVKEL